MCAYSNCRNEFLVIINSYVEFNPTVRGLNEWRQGQSIKIFEKEPKILEIAKNKHHKDGQDGGSFRA